MREIISEKEYSRHAAVEMMQPFSVTVIAGALPNFMKVGPIVRAFNARKRDAAVTGIDLRVSIVHAGPWDSGPQSWLIRPIT